jgi:hypothetical protein
MSGASESEAKHDRPFPASALSVEKQRRMLHWRSLSNGDVNGPMFDDDRPAKSPV